MSMLRHYKTFGLHSLEKQNKTTHQFEDTLDFFQNGYFYITEIKQFSQAC